MSSPETEDTEITDEQIYAEFEKYREANVIESFVASSPLGETWVLCIRGEFFKLTDKAQAVAFLAGASAVTMRMAELRGIRV